MTALCGRHVFGLDSGAACSEPADHNGSHIYRSAWAADRHDEQESRDE